VHHLAFPSRQAPTNQAPPLGPDLDAPEQRKTHLFPVGEPPSACVVLFPFLVSVEAGLLERRRVRGTHFQLDGRLTNAAPPSFVCSRATSGRCSRIEPPTPHLSSEGAVSHIRGTGIAEVQLLQSAPATVPHTYHFHINTASSPIGVLLLFWFVDGGVGAARVQLALRASWIGLRIARGVFGGVGERARMEARSAGPKAPPAVSLCKIWSPPL
jgi:hypothetical protein